MPLVDVDRLSEVSVRWRPILLMVAALGGLMSGAAAASLAWLDGRIAGHAQRTADSVATEIERQADSIAVDLVSRINAANEALGAVRCAVLRLHGEGVIICSPNDNVEGG